MLDDIEGFTLRTFCGVLRWSKEDALLHAAKVRKELKSDGFHSTFELEVKLSFG